MKIFLSSDYRIPRRPVDLEDYGSTEIPKGGMGKINCTINGVNLSFYLLTEDMTKLAIGKFQILSFGAPTPFHKSDQPEEEKVVDPRNDINFQIRAIKDLSASGVICYSGGFEYFPKSLPLEAFGFSEVYSKGSFKIAQKREDIGDRLEEAYRVAKIIEDTKFALAATHPELVEYGYYKNAPKKRRVTLEKVINVYQERLKKISRFVNSIPNKDIQMRVGRRIEFLLVNPIATDGVLDEAKVVNIMDAPEDADHPEEKLGFGPYFGNPAGLIRDHNEGKIDIYEYYKRLISEFYTRLPQLKQQS